MGISGPWSFRNDRKDAYPKVPLAGYSVGMPFESLFSPTTLLWLVVSVIAVATLLSSINRRRTRLTESLREYVDRHAKFGENKPGDGESSGEDERI